MQSNILPLDIRQLSFDVRGFNPESCGVYLKLIAHYWEYGPLPNDLGYIASIVGLRDYAPGILKTCLGRLFHVEADGRLHSRAWGFRFRSEKDKAKKRKERARHAAERRWEQYRERRRKEYEQQMTCSEHTEGVFFTPPPASSFPPPTPPSISPPPFPQGGTYPPPTPPSVAQAAGAAAPPPADPPPGPELGQVETAQDGENKAKPRILGFRALRRRANDGNLAAGGENGREGHAHVRNRHCREGSSQEKLPAVEDARFEACRELVFGYWAKVNAGHKLCPWGLGERRALRDLLEVNPLLTVEHLKRCLENRAGSRVNPAAMPGDWLRRVMMFGECALNEYDKPLRERGQAAVPRDAGVYRAPETPEEIAADQERRRRDIEEIFRIYRGASPKLKAEMRGDGWNPEHGPAPWEGEPE